MAELTMLTEMMSRDLEEALAGLKEVNISLLDLKGGVFGRSIENLDDSLRSRLAEQLDRSGARAYCFSSVLGHKDVSRTGEKDFRDQLDAGVSNLLATADYVRPRFVRLLGCTFTGREDFTDSNEYLRSHAPWVWPAYRDAVDRLAEAGIAVTIENEPRSIFANAAETLGFFDRLGCGDRVGFTWDIQNMWQSGTYPDMDVYRSLRPIINYVHLKGGRGGEKPHVMAYRSVLADATWPVVEIVSAVLADGVSPVICLNSSHGSPADDDPLKELWANRTALTVEEARRDIAFLRKHFPQLSP